MSYRITYGRTTEITNISSQKRKGKLSKWICFVLVSALLLSAFLNKRLRYFLLPGNPQVTEKALIELTADIKDGEPLSEAVTAFCREILDNA